ncbi:MAG: hypothetical protein R3348_02465 [Xanthomonadales bacterium]|nr:hypothetical protein [Xanthomonadales bacterium]
MSISHFRKLGLSVAVSLLAVPATLVADDSFPFPSAGSNVVGSLGFIDADEVGFFWSVARGDLVSESFTSSCISGVIESATLNVEVVSNVLASGQSVDWDFSLNGAKVGDFSIPDAFVGAVIVPTAGVLIGPDFDVEIKVTNEVPSGLGSHSFAYADPFLHSVDFECLGAYATVGGKTVCTGGNESSGDGDGNGQFTPVNGCDGEAAWVTDTFVSGFIGLTSDTATGDPDSFPYSGTPIEASELTFMTKNPSRQLRCTYTPSPTSVATIDEDQTVLSGGWLTNCWDADNFQYAVDLLEGQDIILTNATGAGKGRDKDRGSVCFGPSGTATCSDPVLTNYTLVRGSVDSAQE